MPLITPATAQAAKTSGGILTKIFGKFFSMKILFILLLFILINSIIIGVHEKSFDAVIKDLGSRFLTPTLKIQEFSNKIINQQSICNTNEVIWVCVGKYIFSIWDFLVQFYITYLWIRALMFVATHLIIADDSKPMASLIVALIIFLFFQVAYIALYLKGDPLSPLKAFVDLFKAIKYFIKPVANIGETLINKKDVIGNITGINMSLK